MIKHAYRVHKAIGKCGDANGSCSDFCDADKNETAAECVRRAAFFLRALRPLFPGTDKSK